MRKVTILILTVANTIYVAVGGLMFYYIESNLSVGTGAYENLLQFFLDNNTCASETELEAFAQQLIHLYENGVTLGDLDTNRADWDYSTAVLFSLSAVTTIGYGHVTPKTALGRTLCVLYLLFGIPLMAVYMAGIGGNVSHFIRIKMEKREWVKDHQIMDLVLKMVVVNVGMLTALLLIPSAMFSQIEEWKYGESVYFSFTTLTTVGFGDYYPANRRHDAPGIVYKLMTCVWIIVGLAIVATVVSDIRECITSGVDKECRGVRKISVAPMNCNCTLKKDKKSVDG